MKRLGVMLALCSLLSLSRVADAKPPARGGVPASAERIAALEAQVVRFQAKFARLRAKLARLQAALENIQLQPGPKGNAGPSGNAGPQGEQGPQGAPGNLALAGQLCPEGTYVAGFDSLGRVICRSLAPPPAPPAETPEATLSTDGAALAAWLGGLSGRDPGLTVPVLTGQVPVVGAGFSMDLSFPGFALCAPIDPTADPSPSAERAYDCDPDLTAEVSVLDARTLQIAVDLRALFLDMAFDVEINSLLLPDFSGEAYALLEDVQLVATAPLLDPITGEPNDVLTGTKRIGPVATIQLTSGSSTIELVTSDSLASFLAQFMENVLLSQARNLLQGLLRDLLTDYLTNELGDVILSTP